MKKILCLLLAVCYCLAACSTIPSEPASSVPSSESAPKNHFADYGVVIDLYTSMAEAKRAEQDAPTVGSADLGEQDKKVLATLEYVIDTASNITVLGYGYIDLNKDGKDELLLMTSTIRIYAIFTQNASGVVALCGQKGDVYGIDKTGWIYSHTRMEQADLVRETCRRMYLHGESLQGAAYSKTSCKQEDGSVDHSYNRTVNGKAEEIHPRQFQAFYDEYFGMSYGIWMRTKDAGVCIHRLFPEKKDTDGSLGQADFSTYEKVLDTYKKILSLFGDFNISKWTMGDYDNLFTFGCDGDYKTYNLLLRRGSSAAPSTERFGSVYPENGDDAYGYSYTDLNGDGKDELLLTNDRYSVIAVFTQKDGKAILCDLPIRGSYQIWTDGKIRIDSSTTNILRYSIYRVTDGAAATEDCVTFDGFTYYREKNGKISELSGEEALEFRDREIEVSDLPMNACNRASGVGFIPLFGRTSPGMEHLATWSQSAYIFGLTFTVAEVAEDSVSFTIKYENEGEEPMTIDAVATKDGDMYTFDTDGLAGSLEFGVQCIWLHVTDSSVDIPEEGSHLLDYKTEE